MTREEQINKMAKEVGWIGPLMHAGAVSGAKWADETNPKAQAFDDLKEFIESFGEDMISKDLLLEK